jgi:imidazolonepropionase-like amidohydrolase
MNADWKTLRGVKRTTATLLFTPRLLILIAAWFTCVSTSMGAESGMIVFHDTRVFDGKRILPKVTVVVKDGVITAVGPEVALPPGARAINTAGTTLLPGLIDSHTHVFGPQSLRAALLFGVTTELDMFMSLESLSAVRQEVADGKAADMADLRTAGICVTAPGGHGTEYGLKIPTLTSPDGAQEFVDARLAEGSDYIKIIYDDGKAFGISLPTLSRETLKAVIAATHNRKKLAVVHIGSLQGARDVLEAGADGLAHLFIDQAPDNEFGTLAASHHAFVVPTLAVLENVCGSRGGAALAKDPGLSPFLSPSTEADLNRGFPMRGKSLTIHPAEETIRQLKAAHVPVLAGTDAPNPGTTHGASLHRELELLTLAGLTPGEALAGATSLPAERFGLIDRGVIATGKRADLLLVNGDPTVDIKSTRQIAGVWKQGVELDRESYRNSLEKQKIELSLPAAVAPGSGSGLVSDFEDGKPTANFGAGWQISTDSLRGGKSTASFRAVETGANRSKGALLVEGNIDAGLPYAWAGAIFYPGATPMAPADLSTKKKISFWAKADGRTYNVMLFAPSKNFIPLTQTFVPEKEWKQFTFSLDQFDGYDGHDLAGLFIGASRPAGKFALQIDEVRLLDK